MENDYEDSSLLYLLGQAVLALFWLLGLIILLFLAAYEYLFSDKLVKLIGYTSVSQMITDHPLAAVIYIASPSVVAIRKFNKDIDNIKKDLIPVFVLLNRVLRLFTWIIRLTSDLGKLLFTIVLSPVTIPIMVLTEVVPQIAFWLLKSPVAKITIIAMFLNAIVSSYAMPASYTDVPLPVNIEMVSSNDRFRGDRKYEPPLKSHK